VSCARPAKKLEGNAQWREYVALNNSVIQALLNATSQQQGDHRNARRIWPYMWSPNLRAGSPAVGLSRGGYPDRPRSVQCERRKGVGLPGVVRLHQCNRNPCDHTAQHKTTKARDPRFSGSVNKRPGKLRNNYLATGSFASVLPTAYTIVGFDQPTRRQT